MSRVCSLRTCAPSGTASERHAAAISCKRNVSFIWLLLLPERCRDCAARDWVGLEYRVSVDFRLDHHFPGVRRSAFDPLLVDLLQPFERDQQRRKTRQIPPEGLKRSEEHTSELQS